MQNTFTPTNARKDIYKILKQVNSDHNPIMIQGAKNDESEAVIMSRSDYDALMETFELIQNGQLQDALNRKEEETINFDDFWNSL